VQTCARAYAEASFESSLAHVLIADGQLPMADGRGATIIAFRGSANTRDWLTDFRIEFRSTDYGRVHSGFWQSTNSVMPEILRVPAVFAALPVIVTGHSKGAAEALICARLLQASGKPVAAVVTFGGPRVGDALWARGYNECPGAEGKCLRDITQRWVHEEDIVPRMPPWISKYRHVGHEEFCSTFGGVETDPPLLMLAASDLWGTFWGYEHGHIEQAADHPVSRYQEHINSL